MRCFIVLFAYVFNKFRNSSLKNYGSREGYYLSTTVLSWDAMLNMTKVKTELISDADIFRCCVYSLKKI